MLFDTDVLIWLEKGSRAAAEAVNREDERRVSILTCMELLQGALDKQHQGAVHSFLKEMDFIVLPLSANIGTRALIYLEEYSPTSGLRAADAIIAATAVENGIPLLTGDAKHFRAIKELQLKIFKPGKLQNTS